MVADWWFGLITGLSDAAWNALPEFDPELGLNAFSSLGLKLGLVGCWLDLPMILGCVAVVALYAVYSLAIKAISKAWEAIPGN